MAEQRVTLTPQMLASTISTAGRRPDGFLIRPATVPTDDPVEATACTSRTGQRRAPGSTTHHAAVDTRPHILVVHRRRDEHAPYENYIDHTTHRVTYVTTELGWSSLPSAAAGCRRGHRHRRLPPGQRRGRNTDRTLRRPGPGGRTHRGRPRHRRARPRPAGPARPVPAGPGEFRDKLVMCETISAAGARSAPTEGAGSGAADGADHRSATTPQIRRPIGAPRGLFGSRG